MNRRIDYIIDETTKNLSIEQFLKQQGYTHSVLVRLKKTENGILRNNIWARTKDILSLGDQLTISIEEPPLDTQNLVPSNIPLPIIYEDEDIIVVDKPAHMPVHPSYNHYEDTLANALAYYFQSKDETFTFRCMNRLDRDTTGLTIIAKHILSAAILNQQIKSRQVNRTYLAICEGFVEDNGTIDAPIARKEESLVERCVNFETGETAITHYKRLSYNKDTDLSLVELHLKTGRTHQIRVHMKYIGHPLIGDFLYNPDISHINRQALHSAKLTFIHPVTHKKMHFTSDLPSDMKCLFSSD